MIDSHHKDPQIKRTKSTTKHAFVAVLALVPAHLHLAAAAARWSGPCPCRSSPCPRRSSPCPCRSGRQRRLPARAWRRAAARRPARAVARGRAAAGRPLPAPARRLAGPRPRRGGTDRRELRVGGEKTSLGGDVEAEKKEIRDGERGAVKINKRMSSRSQPVKRLLSRLNTPIGTKGYYLVPVGVFNRDKRSFFLLSTGCRL